MHLQQACTARARRRDDKPWPANQQRSRSRSRDDSDADPPRRDPEREPARARTWTISSGGRRRVSCRRATIPENSLREILRSSHA